MAMRVKPPCTIGDYIHVNYFHINKYLHVLSICEKSPLCALIEDKLRQLGCL
jgi:hypothetical protein